METLPMLEMFQQTESELGVFPSAGWGKYQSEREVPMSGKNMRGKKHRCADLTAVRQVFLFQVTWDHIFGLIVAFIFTEKDNKSVACNYLYNN